MTRQIVISTGLKSVGYDAVAHVLEVELQSGPISRYFDDNVRGKYEHREIG